jgi:hypothetical protein
MACSLFLFHVTNENHFLLSKIQKKTCHAEPFLFPLQRQATTTIPAGHKKGEGSSRAFTSSKKPSPSNDHLLLGICFFLAKGITSVLG